MQTSTVHSDKASDGQSASSGLVTLAPRHPGFYIILAPQLKVSRSPRAGRPEGQNLYLWKLFPRILIQTCCFSASYESVRVSAYRNNVKRMVGWATIPHYSNSLLWQFSTVTVPPVALCQVTRSPEHVRWDEGCWTQRGSCEK